MDIRAGIPGPVPSAAGLQIPETIRAVTAAAAPQAVQTAAPPAATTAAAPQAVGEAAAGVPGQVIPAVLLRGVTAEARHPIAGAAETAGEAEEDKVRS